MMITQRFVFFCSVLGFIIVNAVTGSAMIVATPISLGLIWMFSGFRYVIYGISVYLVLSIPYLVRMFLFLPVMLKSETHILTLLHAPPIDFPPTSIFLIGFLPMIVFSMIYSAFFVKWEIGRMFGKRVSGWRAKRHE